MTSTRSPRNSFNRRCLCCTVSWSTGVTMFAVHFRLPGIGLPAGCSSRLFTFAILRNPFSVIFARFAVASKQRSKVREIGIALLISTPLLLMIVPLLIGADQIVQYEVLNVFSDFNPMTITLHIMFIVLPWPLLFSLLIGLDDEPTSTPPEQRFSLSSGNCVRGIGRDFDCVHAVLHRTDPVPVRRNCSPMVRSHCQTD